MKRRSLITALAVVAGLPLVGSLSLAQAPQIKPLKVLLVTGGCCHDYDTQKLILEEGLRSRANVEVTVFHEEGPEGKKDRTHKLSLYQKKNWAEGYDVVVHNECFGAITDNDFIDSIAKPHHDGVPAVMLHCSTHSYRAATTDEWRKTLGQTSMKHEKARDLTIKNRAEDHPIMKKFPKEWVSPQDELYINLKLWENFKPLAFAYGEETKQEHAVIWTNQYGKGKVFGTTLGHGNDTMSDPVFLDLVTRGVLWVTDRLDAEGNPIPGAGVQK